MTIRCAGCGRTIAVPDDRAVNPELKVRCSCGALFALSEASLVLKAPAGPVTPPANVAAAPMPRPPRPAAVAAAAPSAAPPAAASAPPAPPPRPVSWRRCVNHPQVRSQSMCPGCLKGYCEGCESAQKVQSAVVCPACDGLCIGSAQYEERQARGRQQARSLMEEVGTIVAYPVRDVMGFVMLALFTWFFGMLAKFAMVGGGIAIVLSQGVLLSYCFFALSRVASGNLRDFTPDFRDISDLIQPLRLGLAALIISYGPLLAVTVLAPGLAFFTAEGPAAPTLPVARAQEQPPPSPEAAEEEAEAPPPPHEETVDQRPRGSARATSAGLVVLFGLALLWKLVYTPVALTVAALSRGFFKTLNPLLGIDTIRRMGTIYWQALGIYSVFAAGQWVLGLVLGFVPIAGSIVRAFLDAYAYLAIGCTLGLAVFKKARELGWD